MSITQLETYKENLTKSIDRPLQAGIKTIKDFLSFTRENGIRESRLIKIFGGELIKRGIKKDKEGLLILEQVSIASLDCGDIKLAELCFNRLLSTFPKSVRVQKIKGMILEAKGEYDGAKKLYQSLLSINPTDSVLLKRLICIAKEKNEKNNAVILLKEYLNVFMTDLEAWMELADLYISLQLYKYASFCYEEVMTFSPQNYHIYIKYAEVHYSIGGIENLKLARKYYSYSLEISEENNIRGLYGLLLTAFAINSLSKGSSSEKSLNTNLFSLASKNLKKHYENSNSNIRKLLDNMISNLSI